PPDSRCRARGSGRTDVARGPCRVSYRQMTVAAAIVAGGRGRRLGGVDKAQLSIGGITILERQLAVLRPLFDEVLLVADDPSRYEGSGARLVRDLVPEAGPLAGLDAALAATRADAVLLLGCDLPFL